MHSHHFLAAVLAIGNAIAAPASGYSTSVSTQQTCITRQRPGRTSPATLPTSTRTSAKTITTTKTVNGAPEVKLQTATPPAITSTEYVNATTHALSGTGASASTVYVTVSASPSAAGNNSCGSTTTVSADATSTVYTGTYNAATAKTTASPMDLEKRNNPLGNTPLVNRVGHWFGKAGISKNQAMSKIMKPFEVDCLEQATTYLIATTTESGEAAVSTIQAEAEVVHVTSTRSARGTSVPSAAVQAVTSTVTAAPTQRNGTAGGLCTVTSGEASATTTQHLKCAPTNLISEVNGYGIGAVQGAPNVTQGLAPGSDPSACCQLCLDTEGCAASEDDPDAGNCFLWYTEPSCGLGFSYANGGEDLEPGKGFLVQSGCGHIEAGEDPEIA